MKTTCQFKKVDNLWITLRHAVWPLNGRFSVLHRMTRKKIRMHHDSSEFDFPNRIASFQRILREQCYIPGQYSASNENRKERTCFGMSLVDLAPIELVHSCDALWSTERTINKSETQWQPHRNDIMATLDKSSYHNDKSKHQKVLCRSAASINPLNYCSRCRKVKTCVTPEHSERTTTMVHNHQPSKNNRLRIRVARVWMWHGFSLWHLLGVYLVCVNGWS